MDNSTHKPESPCIMVCTLDDTDVCVGCGRTLDEIARWARMDRDEQWAIIDRVSAQKARRA